MTLSKNDAVARIYSGDSITPTREEYIQGGIRAELLDQAKHISTHGDNTRAARFTDAVKQLDESFGITEGEAAKIKAMGKRPTGRLLSPRAFLVGYSTANMQGMKEYLDYTGQSEFMVALAEAARKGVEPAEALTSFYAKLCYKSLVVGENANITQVRDIPGNIAGAQKQAHGSVFEHISLNWVVTDCSRVYTHEQVRHRVGVAYSQTSGRYCRIEPGNLAIVFDPILEGCEDLIEDALEHIEKTIYLIECRKGLRKPPERYSEGKPEDYYDALAGKLTPWKDDTPKDMMWVPTGKEDGVDFGFKKKLTSAARRIAPNGQTNEMGMTTNIRTLRHQILMRTARFAEWEIRVIFGEIYQKAKMKWPLMFADAKERMVDGALEVYGMKMNPYERMLTDYEDNELWGELYRRGVVEAEIAPIKPSEYPMNGLDNIKLLQEMGRRSLIVQKPNGDVVLGEGVDQSFLAAKHQGDQAPAPTMEQLTGGDVVEVGPGAEELPPEETGEASGS